jgi:GNAT superfamily N-acetyltransferase
MLLELADHEHSRHSVDLDQTTLSRLLQRHDAIVFIAELDGQPVGYVSAIRQIKFWTGGEVLALDDLFVRRDPRNDRIGQALMHALATHTTTDTPTIRRENDPSNQPGHRFYNRSAQPSAASRSQRGDSA